VRDTKNKTLIVKLVNMLPVAVQSAVDMKNLPVADSKATKFLLQGNPSERNQQPVESVYDASQPGLELPPYSFTVLRFKL